MESRRYNGGLNSQQTGVDIDTTAGSAVLRVLQILAVSRFRVTIHGQGFSED